MSTPDNIVWLLKVILFSITVNNFVWTLKSIITTFILICKTVTPLQFEYMFKDWK